MIDVDYLYILIWKVEDYYKVIKHPMDLSKITEKLNEGSYQTLEDFEVWSFPCSLSPFSSSP